ncbi:MAG: extracellular solute-binding protein [Anaerolineales bacterium]|nr:extracellular solute-binding protein [Anaerolineales bacterium]
MRQFVQILIIANILFLAGCQGNPQEEVTPTATVIASTPTKSSYLDPTPTSSTKTLRIWMPPQFSPNSGSPSGEILKERLEEFTARRPGVQIEIREKSEEGAASLINSLTTTSVAAPEAVPDLIALPHSQLQVAVLKGMLHPYDGLTEVIDEEDWFEYANQLGRLQNSTFGLPFAGNAMVMVYRSSIEIPPVSFSEFLTGTNSLAYPAGDTKNLFPTTLYLAAGGNIYDDEGKLTISPEPLSTTLSIIDQSLENHLMSSWVAQIQSDEQCWQALNDNRTKMIITWSLSYFNNLSGEYSATTIPTTNGAPFTLASGWVWALANPHRSDQSLAVELAEFLSDTEFQTEWTMANGYLPTRRSALNNWEDESLKLLSNRVIASANIVMGTDDITRLNSIFYKAALTVIQGENDPSSAVTVAIDSLTQP